MLFVKDDAHGREDRAGRQRGIELELLEDQRHDTADRHRDERVEEHRESDDQAEPHVPLPDVGRSAEKPAQDESVDRADREFLTPYAKRVRGTGEPKRELSHADGDRLIAGAAAHVREDREKHGEGDDS